MKMSERKLSLPSKREDRLERCFRLLVQEIHTVVASSVDDDGLPSTCALDIMDWDGQGLLFLTARGKALYHRLKSKGYMALTGIKGGDAMSSYAISVRGKVAEVGEDCLGPLLEKNPYMYEIYPSMESRKALSAFRLYEGEGEFFDLSVRLIVRWSFSFGPGEGKVHEVYAVSDRCTGCGLCLGVCPQACIDSASIPFTIHDVHCLMCGRCAEVCLAGAVEKEGVVQ